MFTSQVDLKSAKSEWHSVARTFKPCLMLMTCENRRNRGGRGVEQVWPMTSARWHPRSASRQWVATSPQLRSLSVDISVCVKPHSPFWDRRLKDSNVSFALSRELNAVNRRFAWNSRRCSAVFNDWTFHAINRFPMIYVRPGKEKLAVKVNVIRFKLGWTGLSKHSSAVISSGLKRNHLQFGNRNSN